MAPPCKERKLSEKGIAGGLAVWAERRMMMAEDRAVDSGAKVISISV